MNYSREKEKRQVFYLGRRIMSSLVPLRSGFISPFPVLIILLGSKVIYVLALSALIGISRHCYSWLRPTGT